MSIDDNKENLDLIGNVNTQPQISFVAAKKMIEDPRGHKAEFTEAPPLLILPVEAVRDALHGEVGSLSKQLGAAASHWNGPLSFERGEGSIALHLHVLEAIRDSAPDAIKKQWATVATAEPAQSQQPVPPVVEKPLTPSLANALVQKALTYRRFVQGVTPLDDKHYLFTQKTVVETLTSDWQNKLRDQEGDHFKKRKIKGQDMVDVEKGWLDHIASQLPVGKPVDTALHYRNSSASRSGQRSRSRRQL